MSTRRKMGAKLLRKVVGNYRVAVETAVVVGALVVIRAVLYELGVEGLSLSPLASSIVAGGVFVMGLVIAGTLSDYKDAEHSSPSVTSRRRRKRSSTSWSRSRSRHRTRR